MNSLPIDIRKKIGEFLGVGDIVCLRHASKLFICLKVETSWRGQDDIIKDLIKYDRLDLIEYFTSLKLRKSSKYELNYKMLKEAVKTGALDIVIKIVNHKYEKTHADRFNDSGLCSEAAKYGHFDVLKFLHKNNYKLSTLSLDNAIKFGDINIVKWLINECNVKPHDYHVTTSVKHGRLEILIYLLTYIKIEYNVCIDALRHRQFLIFDWLVTNNYLKDVDSVFFVLDRYTWLKIEEKQRFLDIIDLKFYKKELL